MPFSSTDPHAFQFKDAFGPFCLQEGLPLAALTADDLAGRFADEGVAFGTAAHAFWTPALTLWAFLRQVLSADASCRQAVFHVLVAFALSRPEAEADTAAYCRARAKLPVGALQRAAEHVARAVEAAGPDTWLWHGRRVRLVDGSSSRLPDSAANQAAFPQPKTQKPGLGFPLLRWVVLVSLATAAVHGFAWGPHQGKETGETALFRELLACLAAGDVVLADRYYCSYFLVALLQARGIDVVLRLHQRRKYDFRRGRRLGPGDHVVTWQRPQRPKWMTAEDYAVIPPALAVREIRRTVDRPGYRVKEIIVATTLLDAEAYPAAATAELYHERWQVELDIRTLKVTLGLDHLRCLTPAMVARELWTSLLAYNLIRQVAAQAAAMGKISPRRVSFQATKQAVLANWDRQSDTSTEEGRALAKTLLRALRKHQVGGRPGRYEPRARKGRPKPHRLLTVPRAEAKAEMAKPWSERRKW